MATHDRNSYEQSLVAEDQSGRKILNDTIGPKGWLGENARDREEYARSLRPVDNEFLNRASPKLHVVTRDYADTAIEKAFNWDEVAEAIKDQEGDWYIVAFRSERKADVDNKKLFAADEEAQLEAIQSGGLLKYWYGDLNEHRRCLAMCIWIDRSYAMKATHKPLHLKAARLAGEAYESYHLERYNLIKHANEGKFIFEKVEKTAQDKCILHQ